MVVGIIAEYNPFHNGHSYQIEQIKKKYNNAYIIAIMSGSFTQRGEPAILDKFTRAKLAVVGGCDLVLELPFVFAVRSAQDFAYGGIKLLKKIGIVDILAFGAEIDDICLLKNAANKINTDEFKKLIHDKLDSGISYADAICQVLSKITGTSEKILKLQNVILAIEYLRALKSAKMCPFLIKRIASSYNDDQLHNKISSALAIRNSIYSCKPDWNMISTSVQHETFSALKSAEIPFIENIYRPLIAKIICSNSEDLKKIYGMNEGLNNKIISAAHSAKNFNEFINIMISKRYTRSRIQRLLLYLLVGLKDEQIKSFNSNTYLRILAFNQRGRELIREIKKSSNIPVITKIAQHITSRAIYNNSQNLDIYQKMLKFDIISTDIFATLYQSINLNQDFLNSPKYLPFV